MSENIRYFMRCPFCDNNPQSPLLERPSETAIIRAFVERVEKRVSAKYNDGVYGAEAVPMYLEGMQELEAMKDELSMVDEVDWNPDCK